MYLAQWHIFVPSPPADVWFQKILMSDPLMVNAAKFFLERVHELFVIIFDVRVQIPILQKSFSF